MTLLPEDDLLRAIRREGTRWVPDGMEGIALVGSSVIEHSPSPGADDFGVQWSRDPSAEGAARPAPGGP